MRTIHKYPLFTNVSKQRIHSYNSILPLRLEIQNGTPTLWCEVDTEDLEVEIDIYMFGTGQPIDKAANLYYLGTVFANEFVWHYYMDLSSPQG